MQLSRLVTSNLYTQFWLWGTYAGFSLWNLASLLWLLLCRMLIILQKWYCKALGIPVLWLGGMGFSALDIIRASQSLIWNFITWKITVSLEINYFSYIFHFIIFWSCQVKQFFTFPVLGLLYSFFLYTFFHRSKENGQIKLTSKNT